MTPSVPHDWSSALEDWLVPFLAHLSHTAQRRWAPVYLRGLLGGGERKSVAPLASRVAPGDYEQLHHFVAASRWDTGPLEEELARRAQALVGGPRAVLIVDDTSLPKQGQHSVGVAHQYCGCLGKQANCQTLVSLTLARDEVPVPLALRLFLPKTWTEDPKRCEQAYVPKERREHRTKGRIALDEIDRVREAGVEFGAVLADAGYGAGAEFRQALTVRGLTWAVGVLSKQKVYPIEVELRSAPPGPTGRQSKHPVASLPRSTVKEVLAALPDEAWHEVAWRNGTRGPLRARFAAVRGRVADGPKNNRAEHLPGEAAWLVGEDRATGERKYHLTNHPADTPLETLVEDIKARWSCEQMHQQAKEELGLDHFEGRSWHGLHHHALLSMIALAFLQHLRLRLAASYPVQTEPGPPPSPSLPAVRRAVLERLAVALDCCHACGSRRKRDRPGRRDSG